MPAMLVARLQKLFIASVVVALFGGLGGCASRPQIAGSDAAAPMATCEVCQYNRDLGCVRFRLKQDTPQVQHEGKTYCFCSEDCRAAFQKNPARYLRAAAGQGAETR
jgi:YHS domain-containing protein